jgi:homospermidine synthase
MAILRKLRGREVSPDGAQERTFCVSISVAADAADEVAILVSHQDLYIKEAYFIPNATLAEHATNFRTVQLRDKGTDGTGTTAVSAIHSTETGNEGGFTAFVDQDLVATEGYKLNAGQVLAFNVTDDGTTVLFDGTVVVVCK